ncbi:rna family protein [Cystoisospora suis]|uniref:Rna family protein n=1 Tax=Cystoisospora suis TaxID=483139 RepID=A0A2C6L2B0_9APIC|nr:rna family protein [Cystoisospora suis]
MRTAMSLGVNSILLSPVSYAAVNARSARVSMGAMFHLRLLQCIDTRANERASRPQVSRSGQSVLAATLQQVKRVFPGCAIVGTSPRGDPRILFHASDWIRNCCKRRLQVQVQASNGKDNDVSGHSLRSPADPYCGDSPGGGSDETGERYAQWALVVGNEKKGSSQEVLEACDGVAAIAQARGDSLNVSTAAAVALYCLQQETLTKLRTEIPFIPDEELDGEQP